MNMAKGVLLEAIYYRKMVGNGNLICSRPFKTRKRQTYSQKERNSYYFMQWTQDALRPPVQKNSQV